MRSITAWRLRSLLGGDLAIVNGITTLVALLAAPILVSKWGWAAVIPSTTVICWLLIRFARRSAVGVSFLDPVDFGNPGEYNTVRAVDGLLRGEKGKPYFVYAAAVPVEVGTICSRLESRRFCAISGGPGEGKSIAGFLAAQKVSLAHKTQVYTVLVEALQDKQAADIPQLILSAIQSLPHGGTPVLIIDDAHRLPSKAFQLQKLKEFAEDKDLFSVIWIETEFFADDNEGTPGDEFLHIDFHAFQETLQAQFYGSANVDVERGLRGKIPMVEEAIKGARDGSIRTAWQFAFVASRAEQRWCEEIVALSDIDLMVLFMISAHTVISGELEISNRDLLQKADRQQFGWLKDSLRTTSFRKVLRSLEEHRSTSPSLISTSDRSYVASLHFNSARTVIQLSLRRTTLTADLMETAAEFLSPSYQRCNAFGSFLATLPSELATTFAKTHLDWLVGAFAAGTFERVGRYPRLLQTLRGLGDTYGLVVAKLDMVALGSFWSGVSADEFPTLCLMAEKLGTRKDEFIGALDVHRVATVIEKLPPQRFDYLAAFMDAAGPHWDKFKSEVSFPALAENLRSMHLDDVKKVTGLVRALGPERDALFLGLSAKRDVAEVVRTICAGSGDVFLQLAVLLQSLDDAREPEVAAALPMSDLRERTQRLSGEEIAGFIWFMAHSRSSRGEFHETVDWLFLLSRCPITPEMLRPLGGILEEMVKQCLLRGSEAALDDASDYLRSHDDDILHAIQAAYRHKGVLGGIAGQPYDLVAKFLWNCSHVDPRLARWLARESLPTFLESFVLPRCNLMGRLLNAMWEADHGVAQRALRKTLSTILGAMNRTWRTDIPGVQHLIKAIYRTDAELWRSVIREGRFKGDPSKLELKRLCEEVDEITLRDAGGQFTADSRSFRRS